MKIPTWAWLIWAVLGLALEGVALVNGVANDTLTETIVRSIPGWLVFMGVGWLCWHFLQSYKIRHGR